MRRRRVIAAALLVANVAPLAPPTKRRLNFINLTNGIEALPAGSQPRRSAASNHPDVKRMIFMASCRTWTTICCFIWRRAPSVEYMITALGERAGPEVEQKIPRAIWWGLVWVRYALEDVWKIPHD